MQAATGISVNSHQSKPEIFAEYVNGLYWGKTYWGIRQAASGYFNCEISRLSVAQCFFLAERIAMPNRFSTGRLRNILQREDICEAVHKLGLTFGDLAGVYSQAFDVEIDTFAQLFCAGTSKFWLQVSLGESAS